jgi:ATP-dependent DNA helicase PIF1
MSDYDRIREYITSGHNIFLTGPGGVGKSYYINKLKEEMKDNITITSTTGVSSFNLKAQTIHSFSGIGAFKRGERLEDILKRLKKTKRLASTFLKIEQCSLLVIDEISMLGQYFLEMIDKLFRKVRHIDQPLGGIQVIFTGDFLQLPPVSDEFCFKSEVWSELDLKTIYLTKMYRVSDPVYSKMLERIRMGKHNAEDNQILYKRFFAYKEYKEKEEKEKENLTSIQPTFLYSKKVNVHEKNMEELEKNPNEMLIFRSLITDKKPDIILNKTEELLYLKIGAQVMLTVNLDCDNGLVNGSRGVITGYDTSEQSLAVKFLNGSELSFQRHEFVYEEDGKVLYKMIQFPFILAYALSIHKVQGCTLDYAIVDIGHSVFEASMSYVALSRVRSLEGLFLEAYQPYKIFCDKEALEFYEKL